MVLVALRMRPLIQLKVENHEVAGHEEVTLHYKRLVIPYEGGGYRPKIPWAFKQCGWEANPRAQLVVSVSFRHPTFSQEG